MGSSFRKNFPTIGIRAASSNSGLWSQSSLGAMEGGSELQILEPRLEQLASAFYLPNHQSSYQSSEPDTLQSVVKPHHLSTRDRNGFDESSCSSNFQGSGNLPTSSDDDGIQKNKSFFCGCASSGSNKRIKWTKDLHRQFVECVNGLGGAEKATPKAVLKLMKSNDELTIYHVKSHLQRYRYEKHKSEPLQGKPETGVYMSDTPEAQLCMKIHKQIEEALQMQLDSQRHLHHQLEIQQKLQMMIEEQGKQQVKMMLEKQQKKNKED